MQYDIEIRQITIPADTEGYTKANVMLRIGPLMIKGAKIFEKDKERWLSMPARRMKNGSWIDIVYFTDREDRKEIEELVLRQYDLMAQQASLKPQKQTA
ncbi:septation protein SpoVG family protein [bacterium]|nr:septation protein SpoVG family protein [bacterium]